MLDRLTITNLKGIRSLTIGMRPFTLLVGPNAVGKTTILDAIYLASEAARSHENAFVDFLRGERWCREDLVRVGQELLQVEILSGDARIKLQIARVPPPPTTVVIAVGQSPEGPLKDEHQPLVQHLREATGLRLDAEQIARPVPASLGAPKLSPDGFGLAGVLQHLHGLRDGSLESIEQATRAVVPRFQQVKFEPTRIHLQEPLPPSAGNLGGTLVWRYVPGVQLRLVFDDNVEISATHASEGTLLTLAILALAHAPAPFRRRLLLIEDLDRGLHPAAQAGLIKALYRVLEDNPDLQVVATTHSADLVDACDAEDVRVLGMDARGDTAARALTEHPEAARWLKLLRVGEFWGTVGEDWVTGPPTTPT
ncbi:MAG: AAA family ATPase [Deltaproteobacteria bacterium]|nr:AAA family ATPase [Deltaproteobacteria bacterium]